MRAKWEAAGACLVLAALGGVGAGCALDSGGLERRRGDTDAGASADASRAVEDGGVARIDARVVPGVDAGTPDAGTPPPSDAGPAPRDAGTPPRPDAGPSPSPDAGPGCTWVDGVWSVGGTCGPDTCTVSQTGCRVTMMCGRFTAVAVISGGAYSFGTADGSCSLTFTTIRATGTCMSTFGSCSIDANRTGPR